jgi:hypothetical protein
MLKVKYVLLGLFLGILILPIYSTIKYHFRLAQQGSSIVKLMSCEHAIQKYVDEYGCLPKSLGDANLKDSAWMMSENIYFFPDAWEKPGEICLLYRAGYDKAVLFGAKQGQRRNRAIVSSWSNYNELPAGFLDHLSPPRIRFTWIDLWTWSSIVVFLVVFIVSPWRWFRKLWTSTDKKLITPNKGKN